MLKRIVSFVLCCTLAAVCCLSAGCAEQTQTTSASRPLETAGTEPAASTADTSQTPEASSEPIETSEPQHFFTKTLTYDGAEYTFEYSLTSGISLVDISTEKEELVIPAAIEDSDGKIWRISKISSKALYYLSGVKKLVLSEGIEGLDPNFPIGLKTTLEELYLPASLQILGTGYENAEDFQGYLLSVKKGIYVAEDNPWYCDMDGVLFTKDGAMLLRYPTARDSLDYAVPQGTQMIASHAFDGSNVQSLTLPEGLLAVKEAALSGCSGIRKLHIPASVVRIDKGALPPNLTELSVSPDNENFYVEIEDGTPHLYNRYGELLYEPHTGV